MGEQFEEISQLGKCAAGIRLRIMETIFNILRFFTKPAYRIQGIGLGRLCEFVRRWAARHAPETPLLIEDFRGGARFRCFLREHMGSQIFFRGSYSGDQLTIIEKLLGEYGVFVDAGANQGEFSIAAAKVAHQGKIIAFEPVSEYRQRLLANIQLNDFKNVQVIAAALGEQEGLLPIYDQPENFTDGTRHEGLPTLFATESRHHAREVVPVRRLDDVVRELGVSRVDIIKLDIEGAEWIALRGAINTITSYRPTLILEIGRETCRAAGYEPEALVEWLTSLNYRIEKVIEGGKTLPINPALLDDFQNIVAYPA
jgi:FkbM family methyltransferase